MKKTSDSIKNWILNHRIVMTALLIVTGILLAGLLGYFFYKHGPNDTPISESMYYSTQIISFLYVIAGAIIAAWQYYVSSTNSQRDLTLKRVQAAVELSKYYKDNILILSPSIKEIFIDSGISNILSNIDITKIKHFDTTELNELLGAENINALKKTQESKEFFNAMQKANLIHNLGMDKELFANIDDDDRPKDDLDRLAISRSLNKLIIKLLNSMEYFAMNFTHKVADESVVYESLHQTYISIVQMLYYNISNKNNLSTKKFYSNLIELYDIWYTRSQREESAFVEDVRHLRAKGTVVDDK